MKTAPSELSMLPKISGDDDMVEKRKWGMERSEMMVAVKEGQPAAQC